ncbi:jg17011, partial [Pararge aegeria aegeria]
AGVPPPPAGKRFPGSGRYEARDGYGGIIAGPLLCGIIAVSVMAAGELHSLLSRSLVPSAGVPPPPAGKRFPGSGRYEARDGYGGIIAGPLLCGIIAVSVMAAGELHSLLSRSLVPSVRLASR